MIRSIRKRPRPDILKNQDRKPGGSVGRRVYMFLLLAFGVSLLNFLFGDLVLFRADGLVIKEQTIVSATSVVRIEEVSVDQGQSVQEDQIILKFGSVEILESLAGISSQVALLIQRKAELQARVDTALALYPIAERRATFAKDTLESYEKNSGNGLITNTALANAFRARFDAEEALAQIAVEKDTLQSETEALEVANRAAQKALLDLHSYYSEGVVRAPKDGVVGVTVPSVGDVYRAGEPILSVYSGDQYILAYLPGKYIFPLQVGAPVWVSSGQVRVKGTITEILPVSDTLPKEFQNTFKPRDRNQLAKIRLDDPDRFNLYEKVRVTRKRFAFFSE